MQHCHVYQEKTPMACGVILCTVKRITSEDNICNVVLKSSRRNQKRNKPVTGMDNFEITLGIVDSHESVMAINILVLKVQHFSHFFPEKRRTHCLSKKNAIQRKNHMKLTQLLTNRVIKWFILPLPLPLQLNRIDLGSG